MWVVNYIELVNSEGSHNNVTPLPALSIHDNDGVSMFCQYIENKFLIMKYPQQIASIFFSCEKYFLFRHVLVK